MISKSTRLGLAFSVLVAGALPALADDGSPTFQPFAVDPECVQKELNDFAYEKRPQTATRYTDILDDHIYFWKTEINMEAHFTEATHGLAYPTLSRLVLEYNNDGDSSNGWETQSSIDYIGNAVSHDDGMLDDLFDLSVRIDKCRIGQNLFS